MKWLLLALLAAALLAEPWQPHWEMHDSGTTASLRAVSGVWASGTGGTWLRNLHAGVVPGAEKLDFRGLAAIDADRAFLMSAGPGDLSKVYETTDGGQHWTLLFTNPDAKGFFDAIRFRDARNGIIAGDPVDGRFVIFTTSDGGKRWVRQPGFPALPGEGAFAASNSCLTVRGSKNAWFGTGGGRIAHSNDGGVYWTVADSGIRHDNASSGVFSIAWADARHGIAVGGDYKNDHEGRRTISHTSDGGRTWIATDGRGYRSAVIWVPARKVWIAVGTSGSDISSDGIKWRPLGEESFNAVGLLWAVGANGRIARLSEFSK